MNQKRKIHPCAEEVVIRFSDMVFRVALSRTGNYNDAEDITQEVFLKYIQKNKGYEDWEHIKAWLIRVTSNLSKNLVNSAWHRHTAPLEDGMDVGGEPPENSEILEAVQKLPEKYREIIRLHYLKGYRVEEISKQLNLNESTVKTRLSRGRKKLREIIGMFVVLVVAGAIGISVVRYTQDDGYDWERITNSAGIVSGSSAKIREDLTWIASKLERGTTVVETSNSVEFREYRRLTKEEIRELYKAIQKIINEDGGDVDMPIQYYRIYEESGETIIFYLRK